MRTTIEIPDRLRTALVMMAAQRKMKGFSPIVVEAIELYIEQQVARKQGLKELLALRGTWSNEEAAETRARITELRKAWSVEQE